MVFQPGNIYIQSPDDNNSGPLKGKLADNKDPSSPAALASGLYACKSCGSYHYQPEVCIYTLSWTDWLAYQDEYMPSQLSAIEEAKDLPRDRIEAKSRELDELEGISRPNWLGSTRMKADLMTGSMREAFWAEESYRRREDLGARRVTGKRLAEQREEFEKGFEEDGSDDELNLEKLKEEFGPRLPRTSMASPFKFQRRMEEVQH